MEGPERIMSDEHKSKAELLQELNALRKRICELEQASQTCDEFVKSDHRDFEEQFRELSENIPVGVYRTTPDGRIIMANPALIQMLGYSSFEELSQRNLEKEGFASGYPRSEFKDLIAKEGKVVGLESAWKRRDGTTLFIIENARAVRDESGKALYYEGIVQDITGRKKIEQDLIKSHEYVNSLLDAAPEPIVITDLNGRIQKVNNAFERNSGIKRKGVVGKTLLELGITPEEEFQKIKSEIIPRLMKEGYVRDFETVAIQRDGTKNNVLVSWTLLKNAQGEPIGVITVGRDITERKKAEETLRESEEKWRSLAENAPDIILTVKPDGTILFLNRTVPPFTIETTVGTSVYDYVLPEHWKTMKDAFEQVVRTGESCSYELAGSGPDGRTSWYRSHLGPIKKDGQVVAITLIATDVTEQKKMEEALRESQRWQRAILDTIPDMAWLKDKESKYIAANEALCKAFGIKSEDFVGKTDFDVSPKDLAERYRADDREVIRSGRRKLIEEPWGKKQGERIWIETIKTPIYNDQGQIIGTSGIARDVTDRKNLERALIESEQRYRMLFNTTPVGVGLATIDGKILTCNNAMLNITGYSEAEIRQINLKDTYVNPHKRIELLEKLRTNDLVQNFEVQLKRKDGTTYWASLTVSKFDQAGQDVILTVSLDITEHKKAEEKIKTLVTAIEQSIDGIVITDMEPKLLYVNEAFARMHGYTPDEIIGMPVARLHSKEQMGQITGGIHQVKTHGSMEGEIEHVKKDGASFPTYMSVTLLKDNDGGPSGMLAVARDITESKQREEELNNYRQKMARSERLASLGTLSAGLAHELNQPLTVITLLIENLLADMESMQHPGTVMDGLREVLDEVSKVTSIARRFRDAARASSQRVYSQVDLKYVAEKTLKLFEERSQRAKITLVLKGFNKLPFIHSSEEEMGQLFFALVENAIQAADGKKNHRLVISGAVKEQHIELQFSDDCGGIKPEYLGRIFEPFFSTKLAGEATGLGLCIAENVVSRAGGKIHVESKRRKGTTFYITLPVKAETNYLTKRGK